MRRSGFTLIEMLLATALSAILLGGVLMVASAASRDAARAASSAPIPDRSTIRLIEWDLTNAATMLPADDGQSLTLIGNCALDPQKLSATGRLARVVYRIDPKSRALTREQRYLDDEIRPEPWIEIAATGVRRINVSAPNVARSPDSSTGVPIASNVSVAIERASGTTVAEVRAR